MRNNKWTAALFAILLFLCGAAVGALAHRYYSEDAGKPKSAEDFRHRYVSEMKSKLHLTSAQVASLQTILDDTKAKIRAAHDACRPGLTRIKDEQIQRIKAMLNPQQIPIYDRMLAEREQRARQQEEKERKQEEKDRAARQHAAAQ